MSKYILNEGGCTVDGKLVIISGTTYQIQNITSMNIVEIDKNKGSPIGCGIVSTMLIIFGVVAILTLKYEGLFFLTVGIFGLIVVSKSQQVKKKYSLSLTTSSGEVAAMTSHDIEFIKKIRDAIHEAMSSSSEAFLGVNIKVHESIIDIEEDLVNCPFCAEQIKRAAIFCKHCKRELPTTIDC